MHGLRVYAGALPACSQQALLSAVRGLPMGKSTACRVTAVCENAFFAMQTLFSMHMQGIIVCQVHVRTRCQANALWAQRVSAGAQERLLPKLQQKSSWKAERLVNLLHSQLWLEDRGKAICGHADTAKRAEQLTSTSVRRSHGGRAAVNRSSANRIAGREARDNAVRHWIGHLK